jgi:hypothetical protein
VVKVTLTFDTAIFTPAMRLTIEKYFRGQLTMREACDRLNLPREAWERHLAAIFNCAQHSDVTTGGSRFANLTITEDDQPAMVQGPQR